MSGRETSEGPVAGSSKDVPEARALRRGTANASEAWDDDFLFQNSASDLHLQLNQSTHPKPSRPSPYAWPSPSSLTLGDEAEQEPPAEASHANQERDPRRAHGTSPISSAGASSSSSCCGTPGSPALRVVSHSSTNSASSSVPHSPSWRSGTPSLTSDWGGATTETEVDTDDWQLAGDSDGETEVESAHPHHHHQTPSQVKDKKLPSFTSLFKGKQKAQPTSTAFSSDRNVQSEPKPQATAATEFAQTSITIIPYTPKRRRADSGVTELARTPSGRPSLTRETDSASPSRTPLHRPVPPQFQEKDTLKPAALSRQSSFSSSHRAALVLSSTGTTLGSPTSSLAPLRSRRQGDNDDEDDYDDVSDVSTTSFDLSTNRPRRKLKRRSQSKTDKAQLLPDSASSLSAPPSQPRKLKKRPTSLTGFLQKPQSSADSAVPVSSPQPSAPTASGWFRRHRPSSSLGSTIFIPGQTTQTLAEALASPPASSTASLASHSGSLFAPHRRERVFSKPAPSSAGPSETSFSFQDADLPRRSMSKRQTRRPTAPDSSPSKLSPTAERVTEPASPSDPPATPRPLPPLKFIQRPGSKEQLSARQTEFDVPSEGNPTKHRSTSISAKPSSYFTIGASSSHSSSPGDNLFHPTAQGTTSGNVSRRLSLSDLRIPARITHAQDRIGQDLQRVKEFKSGIEDLKGYKASYAAFWPTSEGSSLKKPKTAKTIEKIRQQYQVYWECCDVLIDLADGTDAYATCSPRRERAISMFPRGSPVARASREEGRHMELLQEMLSRQQGLESSSSTSLATSSTSPRRPSLSPKASKLPLNLSRTKSRDMRAGSDVKRPTGGSKLNIFSIREYLHNLRKDVRQRMSAKDEKRLSKKATTPTSATSSTLTPSRPSLSQRSVSEPPRTPTQQGVAECNKNALSSEEDGDEDEEEEEEEEEEDWDRSSSEETSAGRRKRQSQRLALDGNNLPKLLEYLEHVKERCTSCLSDLEAVSATMPS